MSQYYFTVAALPYLDFESTPSISYDDFLSFCESTLDPHDYDLLVSAQLNGSLPGDISHPVLTAWSLFEQSLRNELVKLRAPQRGMDGEKFVKLFIDNTTTPLIARNSMKQENPEKAEDFLNKERWNFFNELEAGHDFDIGKLIVYSLRLQLLERMNLFDEEKGKNGFQKIYEQIKMAIKDA